MSASGAVELWHRSCWDVRDVPIVVEPPAPVLTPMPVQRGSRVPRRLVGGIGAATVVGAVLAGWAWAGGPAASLVNIEVTPVEPLAFSGTSASREISPPRVSAHADSFAIPTISGVAIDRLYPALRGWIHPVTATAEMVPERGGRRFGSERHGIERSECGAGHCGVDLDGPRGRPIVAVAAGTVVRVERSELGRDGRSGRYVRIEHDDGTLTAYMHLDEVAPELRVGDRLDPGQYVGTLGATAVYSAAPHLHFSLEIPDRAGIRGDHSETEYVDPSPFLFRARVAPTPRGLKPAF